MILKRKRHISKPWKRTVLDLRGSKWRLRSDRLEIAKSTLEGEIFAATRTPSAAPAKSGELSDELKLRVKRCVAFGQNTLSENGDRHSHQFGLLGTAAALQIMSESPWASDMNGQGQSGQRKTFFRTLNFLELVYLGNEPAFDAAYPEQKEMTLRLSQALRAICSVHRALDHFEQESNADSEELLILADLSANGTTTASLRSLSTRVADTLTESLVGCKTDYSQNDACPVTSETAEVVRSWKFASKSDEHPIDIDEWVFMWSQIVVAVARARICGAIEPQQGQQLCQSDDIRLLREVVFDKTVDLDPRFRIFGLWSISHLDTKSKLHPFRGSLDAVDSRSLGYFAMNEGEVRDLREHVRHSLGDILSNDLFLVDAWLPYSMKRDTGGWKDDLMVVPVVPIVLQLVARYAQASLTERRLLELTRRCFDPGTTESIRRARPYQPGGREGTVNLVYYAGACRDLTEVFREGASDRPLRFKAFFMGLWHETRRWAMLVGLGLIAVGAYVMFVNEYSPVITGVIFGIAASFIAGVAAPPLISFLWGDRY